KLAHTGPHIGCETSHCGACTVDLDGMSVKACTVLTVQCDGSEMLTVEGLEQGGVLHALQQAFHEEHGLQCGYCTPGMLIRAYRLLKENPDPSEQEIRYGISGNLCRCTGYQNIVKAVQSAARKLAAAPAVTAEGEHAPSTCDRRHSWATSPNSRNANRSCREWARRCCARKMRASFAARAATSTISSCRDCCSARASAARMRTRASSASTRVRRSRAQASSRC